MEEYNDLLHNFDCYRTREELKEYIELVYSIIRKDQKLVHSLQLRKDNFKELIEELIPLMRYSFSKYAKNGSQYKVVIGNQRYDGIELFEGTEFYIEFTEYHDGYKENKRMKSMHKNGGISDVIGEDYFKSKESFFEGFKENVKKKAGINYQNTRIIFIISQDIYGIIIKDETLEEYIDYLIKIINEFDFGDNEVFLMKPSDILIYDKDDLLVKVK